MIRFIASDMDGTLLNSKRKIDEEFFDLIHTLEDKGIIMAFASGRNLSSLKTLVPKNIEDKIMYIANNGAQIIYKGEEIYKNTVPLKYINEINLMIKDIKNINKIIYSDNNAYSNSLINIMSARMMGYNQKYIRDITNITSEPAKYSLISEHSAQEKILKALEPLKDKLTIVPSGKNIIDIMNKDVNKGTAIKYIQDNFNILYEETMAFGDYLNDMEMMENAYFSYAMSNGHPLLKEKARFIAEHHDKKGVINSIKEQIK